MPSRSRPSIAQLASIVPAIVRRLLGGNEGPTDFELLIVGAETNPELASYLRSERILFVEPTGREEIGWRN